MPIELDFGFLFFFGLLMAFVIGFYLFIRRTLLNFRKGVEEGRR